MVLPHAIKATDQYALNATDQFVWPTIVGHSLFVNMLPPKRIDPSPWGAVRSITFFVRRVAREKVKIVASMLPFITFTPPPLAAIRAARTAMRNAVTKQTAP
jgi:hypothetical protein